MRILFFCPHYLWPINTGARLRNFYLANALAQQCSVTLVQLLQPGEVPPDSEVTPSFERILSFRKDKSYTLGKILGGLLGPLPISVLNYSSASVSKQLSELLEDEPFDVVQVESIHLFRYLEIIRAAPKNPLILFDWHNIESALMRRYAEQANLPKRLVARRTAQLLEQVECKALAFCDVHTVVSEQEKAELLKRDPSTTIEVIPNGVDTEFYSHHEAGVLDCTAHSSALTLLFVGSMDYHANIHAVSWFVRDIWPRLSQEFPELHFTIAGRNPPDSVQALASSRVHITGTVSDVRPFYSRAFAVVVPLRVAGGTRLKILEAMAAGVPVISTTLGAEGLDVENNVHLLLADTGEEMASAVRSLLEDSARRSQLIESARGLVIEEYDWVVLGKRLLGVYREMIERRNSG